MACGNRKIHVNHGLFDYKLRRRNEYFSNWNSFETRTAANIKASWNQPFVRHLYHKHTSKWSSKTVMNIWWITGTINVVQKKTFWAFRLISFHFFIGFCFVCGNKMFHVMYLECHTEKKYDWSEAKECRCGRTTKSGHKFKWNAILCGTKRLPIFCENDHEKYWPWKKIQPFFFHPALVPDSPKWTKKDT